MNSLTPEHDKRGSVDHSSEGGLHPEISAAYEYVDSLAAGALPTAGGMVWHGWAMREAFLAGISYRNANPSPEPEPEKTRSMVLTITKISAKDNVELIARQLGEMLPKALVLLE